MTKERLQSRVCPSRSLIVLCLQSKSFPVSEPQVLWFTITDEIRTGSESRGEIANRPSAE